jgi:hypothetical protein
MVLLNMPMVNTLQQQQQQQQQLSVACQSPPVQGFYRTCEHHKPEQHSSSKRHH